MSKRDTKTMKHSSKTQIWQALNLKLSLYVYKLNNIVTKCQCGLTSNR
jgi:hypothetical protein